MTHDELVRVVNLLRDLAMHTPEGRAAFVHAGLSPEPAKPVGLSPLGLTEEQARQLEADAAKVIAPEPAKCACSNWFADPACPIHGARR